MDHPASYQPKDPNYLYTGKNWSPENLNFKNRPPIEMITIRGERHSGTGWLRKMINKNCEDLKFTIGKIPNPDYKPNQVKSKNQNSTNRDPKHPNRKKIDKIEPKTIWLDADGKYGWKHGLLPEHFEMNSTDFLIVLFRDIRTWIPKMREVTYEKIPKNNMSMIPFLRSKWEPIKEASKWKNIFQMRNEKYKNWLNYLENHQYQGNSIGLKYETLLENPENFFRVLNRRFGIDACKIDGDQDFIGVKDYIKYQHIQKRRMKNKKKEVKNNTGFVERPIRRFNEWEWYFVRSGVQEDLEENLGYVV